MLTLLCLANQRRNEAARQHMNSGSWESPSFARLYPRSLIINLIAEDYFPASVSSWHATEDWN